MALPKGPPIDRGWAWMVVAGCFLNTWCMVGIVKSFGLIMAKMKDEFDISLSLAALVLGVEGIVFTIFSPFAMNIAEAVGVRRVVIVGGLVGFVGMSLSSLAVSIEYIIIMFGLFFGIGNAAAYGNSLVTVGRYFHKRRSLATGLGLAGASCGQFVMPLIIQYCLDNYGLQGALLICGAIYLHVIVCGAIFRPFSFYIRHEDVGESIPLQNTCVKSGGSLNVKDSQDLDKERRSLINCTGNANEPHLDKDDRLPEGSMEQLSSLKNLKMSEIGNILMASVESLANVIDHYHDDERASLYEDRARMYSASQTDAKHQMTKIVLTPSVETLSSVHRHDNISCLNKNHKHCRPKKYAKLWDFSILKNVVCLHYTVVITLFFFGYFNIILFIPSFALARDIPDYSVVLLISICGLADLVGRIGIGFLADLNWIQRYKLMACMMLVSGVNLLLLPWGHWYWLLLLHSGIYGVCGGSCIALLSVVLIDFMGLDLVSRTLGVLMFFMGIASAIGQPILGAVRDVTGSFDSLFLMCGAPVLLAGILLLFHPLAKKLEHRLHGHKEDETDGEVKLEHGAYRHTECDHDREVKAEEQAHGNHITSQDD